MADMLVKLFHLSSPIELENALLSEGIRIKRALAPDKSKIEEFAKSCTNEDYSDEVSIALTNIPATCYIATKGKKIVGFACFEVTAKNFFGPMAVLEEYRKEGIGKVLLYSAYFAPAGSHRTAVCRNLLLLWYGAVSESVRFRNSRNLSNQNGDDL